MLTNTPQSSYPFCCDALLPIFTVVQFPTTVRHLLCCTYSMSFNQATIHPTAFLYHNIYQRHCPHTNSSLLYPHLNNIPMYSPTSCIFATKYAVLVVNSKITQQLSHPQPPIFVMADTCFWKGTNCSWNLFHHARLLCYSGIRFSEYTIGLRCCALTADYLVRVSHARLLCYSGNPILWIYNRTTVLRTHC